MLLMAEYHSGSSSHPGKVGKLVGIRERLGELLWLGFSLGRLDGSRLDVGTVDGRIDGNWLGELL